MLLLQYGNQDVQLSAAEQLVDRSQTRAVADAMKWLQARLKQMHPHPQQQQGGKTLGQWLEELEAAFDQQVRFFEFGDGVLRGAPREVKRARSMWMKGAFSPGASKLHGIARQHVVCILSCVVVCAGPGRVGTPLAAGQLGAASTL
jgi:hypothetical protein